MIVAFPGQLTCFSDIHTINMLKMIASIFDPMVLFPPILLRGKLLIQEFWKLYYDWDILIENDGILLK